MSDPLIKVEGVSKKFCRSLKRSLWYGMQDLGNELRGHRHGGNGALRPDEFWAVKDVSFELKRGECLGLIGRNGAGKTTLLRMLNGLIKPDQGRIEMRGRVGALIALGAGFNPILTGRENIYVNAAVLGFPKHEIDRQFNAIVDFAGIGEFIDMPVQSYSSGMSVRLGFSIAATLQPDILILDEVLAVGDAHFQGKCFNRIAELKERAAVIFVSHSMPSVARIATTAMMLHRGTVEASGAVSAVIHSYNVDNTTDTAGTALRLELDRRITIEDIRCHVRTVSDPTNSMDRTGLTAIFFLCTAAEIDGFIVDLVFRRLAGDAVAECPSTSMTQRFRVRGGERLKLSVTLDPCPLAAGEYLWSAYVFDSQCTTHFAAWVNWESIIIQNDARFTSPVQLNGTWCISN